MLSVGLDLHMRYSQLKAVHEADLRRSGARIPNELEQVAGFFRSLGEPCRAVLEAGWNWGSMYDWLEGIENVVEVQLAHPYGVRAIAAAQVKTDRIDARMLGQLLRLRLIPQAREAGSVSHAFGIARVFWGVAATLAPNQPHDEPRCGDQCCKR